MNVDINLLSSWFWVTPGMETIGAKWRMEMGIFVQVWFALGIIIISGIAYFVRDFVKLQLVMCLFLPIFTVYIW